MSPTIEELEAKVLSLSKALSEARQELCAARIEVAPFKVGEIALNRRDEQVIVRVVEPQSFGYYYRASPRKLDGSWSKREKFSTSLTKLPVALSTTEDGQQ